MVIFISKGADAVDLGKYRGIPLLPVILTLYIPSLIILRSDAKALKREQSNLIVTMGSETEMPCIDRRAPLHILARKSDAVSRAPLLEVSRESNAVAQALPAAKLGENFSEYSSPFNW